jgi:hypothetical protein
MAQANDQLAAFNKAQMEAALKMAETAAEHMEKLAEVQLSAAKAAYANSLNALRQLAAAKDANELGNLTKGFAQPAWDEATLREELLRSGGGAVPVRCHARAAGR